MYIYEILFLYPWKPVAFNSGPTDKVCVENVARDGTYKIFSFKFEQAL